MDEWFAMLADSRQSLRQMASIKIAELHDAEGKGDQIIERLFGYLTLDDVLERRAAVQCLGMIGSKTLPPLIDMLLTTEDMTVRASCAKCIGAVALKYPELLPEFPQSALDGMKKAILEIPDPVTKIATISTLGQIGGGDVAHGYPGCERAVDVLVAALDVTEDMGLAAAAVNAVATIGYTNEPFRPKCKDALVRLKARAENVDGFFFVSSMIDSQLENLSGGGIGAAISSGRSGADTGAKSSLERQFTKAAQGGFLADTSSPPPMEDDWMSGMIEEEVTPAPKSGGGGKVNPGAAASQTAYAKNKKSWDL
eukprot:Tamp_09703.p1 GENE.Tamp_09703~~Tamp_09703.p1  ORF type:complete len:330 (+),score=86.20 Tamp_09703:60-992(+)